MSTEKVIHYDSPEAAKLVTVTGWVSSTGFFYGEKEDMARWAGCTHIKCRKCGTPTEKAWTACQACRHKGEIERYEALKKEKWDLATPLYSDSHDKYFFDFGELVDFLRDLLADDESITVDDLRLKICKPNMPREIDGDHFSDDMPEDRDDLPKAIEEAIEAFNAVMRAQPPLSWSPDNIAAIVEIDSKLLED
jgi:hypothetical protein